MDLGHKYYVPYPFPLIKGGISEYKDINITKPINGLNIDRIGFRCSENVGWVTLRFRIHN